MKIRADVAELLRAGLSDAAIARELHVDRKAAANARTALGLPKHRPGRRAADSPEDLFWRRTQPTDDGHLLWTGYVTNSGTPAVRHGGRLYSAYRIAFQIKHGRAPAGHVAVTCEREGCVHPNCVEDRQLRDANARADAAFDVIFGGLP